MRTDRAHAQWARRAIPSIPASLWQHTVQLSLQGHMHVMKCETKPQRSKMCTRPFLWTAVYIVNIVLSVFVTNINIGKQIISGCKFVGEGVLV